MLGARDLARVVRVCRAWRAAFDPGANGAINARWFELLMLQRWWNDSEMSAIPKMTRVEAKKNWRREYARGARELAALPLVAPPEGKQPDHIRGPKEVFFIDTTPTKDDLRMHYKMLHGSHRKPKGKKPVHYDRTDAQQWGF
jgi:hypothetical protein